MTQPPIGLIPKFVRDLERAEEIMAAMGRYVRAGKKFPREWADELVELVAEKSKGTL